MDVRFLAALLSAKLVRNTIKTFGGGATAAPGLVALSLDSKILKKLSKNLETTVLITGTNGKTTTSRLLGNFLSSINLDYIHNREGSNLERGMTTSLAEKVNLNGKIESKIGIFEVDEAALAPVVSQINPSVLVITNLFRDQLDRYGEVDSIRRLWEKTVSNLSKETVLVLNADDPVLAYLGKNYSGKVIFFGLNDLRVKLTETPTALDSSKCPQCQTDLNYSAYFLSHLGEYKCPNCNFERPKLEVFAKEIDLKQRGSKFTLVEKDQVQIEIESSLEGLYNVYNCLASYTAAKALNLPIDTFGSVLRAFKPVFGRTERLEVDGRKIVVALAKNPTGFNEIIRTFLSQDEGTVLLAINDLIADGRDVSWLWDVDFESLTKSNLQFFTSGLRMADMSLRLKYAGIKNYTGESDLEAALDKSLSSIPQNDTLTIVPTYTAMLSLKKIFAKKGVSGEFWED